MCALSYKEIKAGEWSNGVILMKQSPQLTTHGHHINTADGFDCAIGVRKLTDMISFGTINSCDVCARSKVKVQWV